MTLYPEAKQMPFESIVEDRTAEPVAMVPGQLNGCIGNSLVVGYEDADVGNPYKFVALNWLPADH